MSLRDLAAGNACGGAGPSSSALSAVADAILPSSTTSLPFAAASSSAAPTSSSVTSAEMALLTGELPPEIYHPGLAGPPPTLAPPRPGAATDVFERAFPEFGHLPIPAGNAPFGAAFTHVTHPPPMQPHAPFDAAFRNASAPQLMQQTMHAPQADAMFEQFARFGLDSSRSKAPVSVPHWPPPWAGMAAPRPVWQAPSAPPLPYAQSFVAAVAEQQRDKEQEEATQTVRSDAQSWGDEFTSLDGGEGLAEAFAKETDVEQVDVTEQLRYDDSFEDMYEAAFRDFLGSGAARQEYRFAEREGEQQHARSALEALEEGVRLREGGKLAMAVRAFEEALNREKDDPHPPLDSAQKAKAWYLLGLTLAETDDDAAAIMALQEGLDGYKGMASGERRQDNPYLLGSLIALAVSYTNEQVQPQAFGHVKEWFEMWCKQNGINETELSGVSEQQSMNGTDLEDVFQDAGKAGAQALLQKMRTASERTPQDADIRIVMGVLHNLNREYSKAAETLRRAVMLRSNDPGLWNKLGATLANGGESDDALRAYRRSVDINPALVRAWVNVGTAYANRGEFPKAARYYLKSVSMAEEEASTAHEKGITGTEDRMAHVWGYLRTTLISMSRADLVHLVDSRDVKGLRSHFNL